MFDNGKPRNHAFGGGPNGVDPASGPDDARSLRGGDALRAIEWGELTARLNAARDLRRELREEAILCAGASGARFGDAAAGFFKMLGDGERPVNPDALEGCKSSNCMIPEDTGAADRGDARDDR
jgi:hypothetical protein